MTSFSSNVSYSVDGNALELTDNDFRIIEQNGVLGQSGVISITDMYPSANFTFGFNLTINDNPTTVSVPFLIEFYDDTTRFKFLFQHTASSTDFTVSMENLVDTTTQIYTIYNGSKPALYPSASVPVLIRLLNGYLWVKVAGVFWLEKLDVQAHPLHLEGGIIGMSVSNTTVLVSHRIQTIYFEPIMCFTDSAYFAKSIFPERYEGFSYDEIQDVDELIGFVGSNLVMNPEDLYISNPVGTVLFDYVGKEVIDDPRWIKDLCGQTVETSNYPELRDALGVPVSQETMFVPRPTLSNVDIDAYRIETWGGLTLSNTNIYFRRGAGDDAGNIFLDATEFSNDFSTYLRTNGYNSITYSFQTDDASIGLSGIVYKIEGDNGNTTFYENVECIKTITADRVMGVTYSDVTGIPYNPFFARNTLTMNFTPPTFINKIDFSTVEAWSSGAFDGTNSEYVVPTTGIYQINISIKGTITLSPPYPTIFGLTLYIYINGIANFLKNQSFSPAYQSLTDIVISYSTTYKFTSGQILDVRIQTNMGTSFTIATSDAQWSGHLVYPS